jgi:RNA polymerase sigma factor (sigma-70 family)
MAMPSRSETQAELTLSDVIREEGSRLTAAIVSVVEDMGLAEDLVQDAVVKALERWPSEGVPHNPTAWLYRTARNGAIDRLRRETVYREKLRLLANAPARQADDRLKLIFTCCHPALTREAQVALTLRTVCGLSTSEIARAFMTKESAIAQRLVRAKKKISASRIPYRVPPAEELNDRLAEVLAVVYLMFNEGYLSSGGEVGHRPDLVVEAQWLARLLSRLVPTEPEVAGLLALIQLHQARLPARFDPQGNIVLLCDQDRSKWDHRAIAEAANAIVHASNMRRPGPYQIQAAIVACHAEAATWDDTDWPQILLLYDALARFVDTPVARLNRAIALRFVAGPKAAYDEVENLHTELSEYRLFHATRAELLRDLGRPEEAREADLLAIGLTRNPAERSLLEQRLR